MSFDDVNPVIIGCGFLGQYLTKLLISHNQTPLCVVRSEQSLHKLQANNDNVQIVDLDDSNSCLNLSLKDKDIYYLAPPSNSDLCDHRIDHFLTHCSTAAPNKIVYISTSGVYGDCAGAWVDESQPLKPLSDRAKRRVYAETALKQFSAEHSTKYVILRVGGIYGAERLPIKRLQTITVICPEEAPYSNRIHVADLANICYTAMQTLLDNEIINVADGHATSMSDYYYTLADFAEMPRPPCVPLAQANEKLSAGMLSFVNESRRLSILKLHKLLDVEIQYPTLALGLAACFNKQA